jgi:DeoR family transcriptional regulator, fructose operon transcriptional repressor
MGGRDLAAPPPRSVPGEEAAPDRMFAAERRNHIARLIETHQRVAVSELATRFAVSEATIRRDLALLDGFGVIQRTHGGAIAAQQMTFEPDVAERQVLNLEEKIRIGQKAVELVEDGDCVVLDAGTTTFQIARAMKGRRRATVVTNALNIAEELLGSPSIEVVMTGGLARSMTSSLVGPYADEVLSRINADKVFLATNGITLSRGLTTPNPAEAKTKEAMVAAANEVIAVADHSKFGKTFLAQIVPISRVELLITDGGADLAILQEIERLGTRTVMA